MSDDDMERTLIKEQQEEIGRLRALLAEANKTIRKLEREYTKLAKVASEVIKWAENSGAGYDIGRKPIDDLRKALEHRK